MPMALYKGWNDKAREAAAKARVVKPISPPKPRMTREKMESMARGSSGRAKPKPDKAEENIQKNELTKELAKYRRGGPGAKSAVKRLLATFGIK